MLSKSYQYVRRQCTRCYTIVDKMLCRSLHLEINPSVFLFKVYKFVEILGEERQATRENVERKQARTSDELEEDEDAEGAGNDDSDEEEEQVLYNPKNLPLGKTAFCHTTG